MTLQEFYDRRDEFIGCKVLSTKTFDQEGVVEKITFENGFLTIYYGKDIHGGIEEVTSIWETEFMGRKFIRVYVQYCGGILIKVK